MTAARDMPVERGLSPAETRVLRAIQAAGGGALGAWALTERAALVSAAAIRVHVCNIRRKRADLGARIATVHGAGYRWTARGERG